jgi:hypothetical protein
VFYDLKNVKIAEKEFEIGQFLPVFSHILFLQHDTVTTTDVECDVDFEDLPVVKALNIVEKWVDKGHKLVHKLFHPKYEKKTNLAFKVIALILYKIYFFWALGHYTLNGDATNIEWCDGLGFLIIITVVVDFGLLYGYVLKPGFKWALQSKKGAEMVDKYYKPAIDQYEKFMSKSWSSIAIYAVLFGVVLIFLIIDTAGDRRRLRSFFGLVVLVILAALGSNNPSRIRYKKMKKNILKGHDQKLCTVCSVSSQTTGPRRLDPPPQKKRGGGGTSS